MRKPLLKWGIPVLVLLVILVLVSIVSLSIGTTAIPLKKILSVLFQHKEGIEYNIVIDLRLPRIVLGIAVGGGLSLAGVLLQGMFRNPLVEPYTLGISGGAALAVCLNIIFGLHAVMGSISLPISGFVGATTVILMLYFLSARRAIMKIHGLLLTGVMISFIASSLIMLIMSISSIEDLQGIIFWIMGSLEEPQWNLIYLVLAVSLGGLVISYFFSVRLNALIIGEDEARHLGINIESTKRFIFVLASLITGFCVSVTGLISFVGLVVPHFVRMVVGQDHRVLLVSSFLSGAIFLVVCDTAARTVISPMELPVGVITGILGGTVFVYALTKRGAVL
jgi:iron complex transport system permease protein